MQARDERVALMNEVRQFLTSLNGEMNMLSGVIDLGWDPYA